MLLLLVYHMAQKSENIETRDIEITTNLYVNPSYITARYDVIRKERTALQRSTLKTNFADNNHNGKVSANAAKKIRLAVQWLVMLADEKKVWDAQHQKMMPYRAGLATVSLPTGCENVSEKFFRDTLLVSILSAMDYKWGLKNYIWKIERQKNGTLHAHITVDKFIPHKWLLETWNRLLDKHGLLEEYSEKFKAMSLRSYVAYRQSTDTKNYTVRFKSHRSYVEALVNAYRKGESQGWKMPNCTDIHAVKNVRNLASYMVKYMSKDPNLGESFKGRFWACSHALSKLRTITVNLPEKDMGKFDAYITNETTGYQDLMYFRRLDGEPVFLGVIYFLKKSRQALNTNPFLNQLFKIIRSLYHSSRLDDLPFFKLVSDPVSTFTLQKIHNYAS